MPSIIARSRGDRPIRGPLHRLLLLSADHGQPRMPLPSARHLSLSAIFWYSLSGIRQRSYVCSEWLAYQRTRRQRLAFQVTSVPRSLLAARPISPWVGQRSSVISPRPNCAAHYEVVKTALVHQGIEAGSQTAAVWSEGCRFDRPSALRRAFRVLLGELVRGGNRGESVPLRDITP
jgi:hypothetical protein